MIKGNGHYAGMGVYSPSEEGKHGLTESDPLLLPKDREEKASKFKPRKGNVGSSTSSGDSFTEQRGKRKHDGKGSNILILVRNSQKTGSPLKTSLTTIFCFFSLSHNHNGCTSFQIV